MSHGVQDWQPTATLPMLRRRAAALASTREFFRERGILEVQTPMLVGAPVSDVNLHSIAFQLDQRTRCWLHTSPEYAMKRLLAAGSGDIWQLCQVARADERSAVHNSEFTLLEWYRVGCSMDALIDDVAQLCCVIAGKRPVQRLRYAAAFAQVTALDPLGCSDDALRQLATAHALPDTTLASLSRDELLDLLMSVQVGPTLGRGHYTFITHYPASQAALARIDPDDARVARRFELYADGIELANGFDELTNARMQRARFAADNHERRRRGLPAMPVDERLLAALGAGLPECSGVALGFDRLLMVATGSTRIEQVLAFVTEHACTEQD